MNKRCLVPLVLVIVLICMPMMPFGSEADKSDEIGNVVYSHFDNEQDITIDETCRASLAFHNKNGNAVLVTVSQPTDSPIKIKEGLKEYPMKNDESLVTTLVFDADRSAHVQRYDVEILITVTNAVTHEESSGTTSFPINVTSMNSNEEYYNKILGFFENPLPSPFNEPMFTAAITVCIWVVVSILIVFVVDVIISIVMKEKNHKRVRIPLFICMMLFAIVNCLRIYGISDEIVSSVNFVANLLYIPLIAFIAWKVYLAIIWRILNDLEKKTGNEYIYEAVSPLFQTIGKILIIVISVAVLLSTLGLNLSVIITGAGIAGLAVSLGTKSAFNEFFSGVTVLLTRPFRKGDTIKVEGQEDEMKVIRVGILRTEFQNRHNVDRFVIPNSTLAYSKIINYTRVTNKFRMFIFVDIRSNENIAKVKEILLKIANEIPEAITDGSVSVPDVRVNELKNGMVSLRLSVYINEFTRKDYIYGNVRERILEEFRENNISAPIPRIGITVMEEKK